MASEDRDWRDVGLRVSRVLVFMTVGLRQQELKSFRGPRYFPFMSI